MRTIRAMGIARIDAPAAKVYGIIADYHVGHPSILPPAFRTLVVESGGVGAGTRIRVEMKIGGRVRTLRAAITEPDPGRVLVESDLDRGGVTTFTVTPLGEAACQVHILTEWTSSGLRGWVESFLAPRMLEPLFREELAILQRVATEGTAGSAELSSAPRTGDGRTKVRPYD
jgi:hypothetical protein